MNKVIFISQPMGGRSSDEINAERRRVIEIARQQSRWTIWPGASSSLQRPMWQSLLRAGRMPAAAALSTSAPRTTASP